VPLINQQHFEILINSQEKERERKERQSTLMRAIDSLGKEIALLSILPQEQSANEPSIPEGTRRIPLVSYTLHRVSGILRVPPESVLYP